MPQASHFARFATLLQIKVASLCGALSLGEFQRALHDCRVSWKRTEEGVALVGLELARVEGDRVRLTTTDDRRVSDHPRIAGLEVVLVEAGPNAVGCYRLGVGCRAQNPVMAHRGLRQLAYMLELDRELFAALRRVDAGLVELHRIVAFDFHVAGRS